MTDEQREILAHIVRDPDAWYAHAVSVFGAELAATHLASKVQRWRVPCEEAKARDGGNYKTRVARDADE